MSWMTTKYGSAAVRRVLAAAAVVALGSLLRRRRQPDPSLFARRRGAVLPIASRLRVQLGGSDLPTQLEKAQIKAWHVGEDEPRTRNFFDIPLRAGVANLSLAGLARGDRLEVLAHVKNGPQYNYMPTPSCFVDPI